MATEVDDLDFESVTFGEDDKSQDFKTYRSNEDQKNKQDYEVDEEPAHNVLFISAASYSDKLNSNAVIKLAESIGNLKKHNFRDKQSFGFLQFNDSDTYEKAIEKLNDVEVDGTKVFVERCSRITPGRDPRTHEANSEFKNSTLVLKNLPFQLKQEKLEELLNIYEVKPVNVSYLYDGTGMFRGMAFVKYKEKEHATAVFESLNNLDINGRKVRVEYKRVTKESENTQDADDKKIQDQLNSFKSNGQLNELAFPAGSSYQKKQLRHIAEKLGLSHYSSGEFIVIKKDSTPSSSLSSSLKDHNNSHHGGREHSGSIGSGGFHVNVKSPSGHSTTIGSESNSWKESGSWKEKGQPIKGRRPSVGQNSNPNSLGKGHNREGGYSYEKDLVSPSQSQGINISRGFGRDRGDSTGQSPNPLLNQYLKSPPTGIGMGSSPTYRNSAAIMNRRDEGIQPQRQPKGPDGTTGFSEDYQKQRQKDKQQKQDQQNRI